MSNVVRTCGTHDEQAGKQPGRLLVATSTWPLSVGDQRTPFVRDLTIDLAARGWEIEVLAPHAVGAARREQDGPVTVRRFRYMVPERMQTLAYGPGGLVNFRSPRRKLQAIPFVIAQIVALRRALRLFRPDVIHAHWLLPQGFTAGIAAGGRVPIVTTVHGSDAFGLRSVVFQPFKRAAVNMASVITCNGPATFQTVLELGAGAEKVRQIPFAPSFEGEADPSEVSLWRSRFPGSTTIALFVGRLIPEKGPADFIEAIARARSPEIRGVICGEGPMRAELQELVVRRGLSARVTFEGWLKPADVAVRMAGADVLLFPSKKSADGGVEGQGIVPLEAMRIGLPVFAARSGGIPHVVRDGETGWLFGESDIDEMSRLLDVRANGGPPGMQTVVGQARLFARNEITRDKSAAAFHTLLTGLVAARRCSTVVAT